MGTVKHLRTCIYTLHTHSHSSPHTLTASHPHTLTDLEQPSLDVLVIHELGEDEELLSQELVSEVHLVTNKQTKQTNKQTNKHVIINSRDMEGEGRGRGRGSLWCS